MIRRLLIASALVMTGSVLAIPSAAGGGFCADPSGFSTADTTEIVIENYCFSPSVAYVQPGDTVTFTNNDSTEHLLGGVNNVFGNLHDEVSSGAKVSYTFDEEGTFPYLCILHPGMAGAIVVGDGRGDDVSASLGAAAAIAEPPDDSADAADAQSSSTAPSDSGAGTWTVVAAVALGLGALAITAIFRRREANAVKG